jgi:Xaa-Pro aminopeptidase
MKFRAIPNELFKLNRANLAAKLKPNSVVIIHSNDIMPTNADGTMPFKQNSNIFYLTGIDQEETIFLMAPDFPDEKMREILFLRETSEEIAVWIVYKVFSKSWFHFIFMIPDISCPSCFVTLCPSQTALSSFVSLRNNISRLFSSGHSGPIKKIVSSSSRSVN